MSDDVLVVQHLCNESTNDTGAVTTKYLFCIFLGSLSVLIMCGNLLVITSVIYFRQLHSPTNYLILSLAVTDLLVGVLVLPLSTISVSSCWYMQDLICTLRNVFDMILCSSSIFNLCFISVDRYYAVCQPLTYKIRINVRVVVIMILVSWTISILSGLTVAILNGGQVNKRCVLFKKVKVEIVGIFFNFYLPAIIMSMIYLKILTEAYRQTRNIKSITCQLTKTERKMERKATRTLAIVMGVFLLCWTPFFLSITFDPVSGGATPVPLIETFKWLGWSNSMFNPLVYGFFYSWFRSAFKIIISGKIFQGNLTKSKLF